MAEHCPPLDDRQAYVAWLRALGDDGLTDYRFELYDRLELAPEAAGLLAALEMVYALEAERAILRWLRDAARVAMPDLDADVFAGALIEMTRLRRQLGADSGGDGAAEIFRGAIEVAERRAQAAMTNEKGG